MKKLKNEVEFVEFEKCDRSECYRKTDVFCVSCYKWFCGVHMKFCVQCEQPVCEECYIEDKCCLVRPWGEKTEQHLRNFYQNKLIDKDGMTVLRGVSCEGNEHRNEAVKRSIAHFVDNFDASSLLSCKLEFVDDLFPRITKYVENKEDCSRMVAFMEHLLEGEGRFFGSPFQNNDVREEMFIVMDRSIRDQSSKWMQRTLIYYAMQSKELFDSMKNKGLLDWNLVYEEYDIGHLGACKWIEENGIDISRDEERFRRFVSSASAEVLEYLMIEKGMTVEYISKNFWCTYEMLKRINRVKGIEGIQRVDPGKLIYDFDSVRFLKSIGYKFQRSSFNHTTVVPWMYSLLFFQVLKLDDLNQDQKNVFAGCLKNGDIKVCKHMFPFLKTIRKKKIMTLLLCIRKRYPLFQKEIIWNILDYAYSPINERGLT